MRLRGGVAAALLAAGAGWLATKLLRRQGGLPSAHELADKASDLADRASAYAHQAADKASEYAERVRDAASSYAARAKEKGTPQSDSVIGRGQDLSPGAEEIIGEEASRKSAAESAEVFRSQGPGTGPTDTSGLGKRH